MVTELKTSELLDRAADLIQERGWTQGPLGWGYYDKSGPLCLEGGILAAYGLDRQDSETIAQCPAYKAVKEYLGDRLYGLTDFVSWELWVWNDSAIRTKDEVIEVLRAAAAVERTKEEALEGAHV